MVGVTNGEGSYCGTLAGFGQAIKTAELADNRRPHHIEITTTTSFAPDNLIRKVGS